MPFRLFDVSMKSAPKVYYGTTVEVNLVDISLDPNHEADEVMASDAELNNTKHAGNYAAE